MIHRILPAFAFTLHAAAAPVEITPPDLRGAQQPQAAVGARGEIHVVFGRDGTIYHSVSTDEARTFRAPVKIGELRKLPLGMRRGPRIAVAPDGRFAAVVWEADEKGARVLKAEVVK